MTTDRTIIAYLGPSGTFSEQAAKKMNAVIDSPHYVERETIADVLTAVARQEVDSGVVPLRTADGDVNDTLQQLHKVVTRKEGNGHGPYITGYWVMPIVFYLAGKDGTTLGQVRIIATKQQALDACVDELEQAGITYKGLALASTALGAQYVVTAADGGIAALCSKEAMEGNGLVSLLPGPIRKVTRFISVANTPYTGPQQDETAIMVRLYEDRLGQLHAITGAILPMNMTDLHLMKDRRDSHGVATVFLIRMNADKEAAEQVLDRLNTQLIRKEAQYELNMPPRLTNLGTYPIIS